MPYFQIEYRYDLNQKFYAYFEANGDEQEKACDIADKEACQLPRILVREYDPSARKRVRKGREFFIILKRVTATLSTGRIISEQWYQPAQWKSE